MQKQRRKRTIRTSPFISKLHEMLQTRENNHLINWSNTSSFYIRHPISFSNTILPKYFKHKNYSSFLRQLNLYNFTKLRSDQSLQIFHHPLFQRGDFQKHLLIKRIDQQSQKFLGNQNESDGIDFPQGCHLQEKISLIKYKQIKLRESCEKLISDNQEIISDNYIFTALHEDQSSNDRIILDRITAFMMHHYKDGDLSYCDSNMIKGLLKFLENNNWEGFFSAQPPSAIAEFFKVIENHQLKTAVKWISSAFGGERKKKNFTIVKNSSTSYQGERDLLSILD